MFKYMNKNDLVDVNRLSWPVLLNEGLEHGLQMKSIPIEKQNYQCYEHEWICSQAQLRIPCQQGNYLQRWYLPLCQNINSNITTKNTASTSCDVQASWWSDLVEKCKCQNFVNDAECQLKLITISTSSLTCKEDSNQECKDYIFKLAYEYKSSPTANTCQDDDPNYFIAQDLAKSCED